MVNSVSGGGINSSSGGGVNSVSAGGADTLGVIAVVTEFGNLGVMEVATECVVTDATTGDATLALDVTSSRSATRSAKRSAASSKRSASRSLTARAVSARARAVAANAKDTSSGRERACDVLGEKLSAPIERGDAKAKEPPR